MDIVRGRMTDRLRRMALGVAAGAMVLGLLGGCSQGVRSHIRQFDFRESNRAGQPSGGAPSPIANVFDMPGWTTDLDGASAFAAANNRRTVVFVRRQNEAASERVVVVLNGRQGEAAVSDCERVAIDIGMTPSVAARLGVTETPAIIVLDPQGRSVAKRSGPMEKAQILALIRG